MKQKDTERDQGVGAQDDSAAALDPQAHTAPPGSQPPKVTAGKRVKKKPTKEGRAAPAVRAGRGPQKRVPSSPITPITRSLRAIVAQGAAPTVARSLPEVKLGPDPARVMMFSDAAETVHLHYEGDESVRSYFHCPGSDAGCPYCRLGKKLEEFLLVAVFAIASREVGVLRILSKDGPNRLLSLLRPFLNDEEIDQKGLAISRVGYRYIIEAFPVRPGADVGATAIGKFLESYGLGHVKLAATFPSFTTEELSDVPAIRNELEILDGSDGGPGTPKPSRLKGKRGNRNS